MGLHTGRGLRYPPDANGESTRPMLDFNSPPGTCPFAKRSNSTRVETPPPQVRGDLVGRSRNLRRMPLLPTEPFAIIRKREAKSRYRQPPRKGHCECCGLNYERGTFYHCSSLLAYPEALGRLSLACMPMPAWFLLFLMMSSRGLFPTEPPTPRSPSRLSRSIPRTRGHQQDRYKISHMISEEALRVKMHRYGDVYLSADMGVQHPMFPHHAGASPLASAQRASQSRLCRRGRCAGRRRRRRRRRRRWRKGGWSQECIAVGGI